MNTLYFRCSLLTDVVLSQRAATEGNQASLDFIPGNNFLGIAAGSLYSNPNLKNTDKLVLFHSGKVRFGDAHPEVRNKRTLKIPASFFYPKLDTEKSEYYIHHEMDYSKCSFQPKQCRNGFYLFYDRQLEEAKVNKMFAIKSAYDRELRRSKDEAMYGYESLQTGSSWIFEVAFEQELFNSFSELVKSALTGVKRIGRSRTAQYGLVQINLLDNYTPERNSKVTEVLCDTTVYADARLIFLDEYGLPTFQPTVQQLGFKSGEIDWSKSQIRTFQYAPWNFKRRTRDAERCGIEKGSVFYVKNAVLNDTQNWVGSFQNEGFGKVIYNPSFLATEPESNGKAIYKKCSVDTSYEKEKPIDKVVVDTLLLSYLRTQKDKVMSEQNIVQKVNDFVSKHKPLYLGDSFASQWGSIRSIAIRCKSKEEAFNELFGSEGYLEHGVAKDKWEERGRKKHFKDFINGFTGNDFKSALINLASEMAKISKH